MLALPQLSGRRSHRSQVLRAGPLAKLSFALAILGSCAPVDAQRTISPSPTPVATAAASPTATARPSRQPLVGLPAPLAGEPTIVLYLPYLARALGGADGWETPFIIQVADTSSADLELSFYAISDGALVARRIVRGLKPGTSYADQPNRDTDLPADEAFSAVVRSFGAKVVAVVNQQRGAGPRFEADSYVGRFEGAQRLFFPSISRGADGFTSRVIVQNIGSGPTQATLTLLPQDGGAQVTVTRSIQAGRSAIIDLGAEPDLRDGQYAATVNATERLVAVANTHRDAPAIAAPMLYSYNAFFSGANTVYGPYAAKNVPGIGAGSSTITVQNMRSDADRPSLSFTPLGGGPVTRFDGPTLAPGVAWAFDLRFQDGDRSHPACGPTATASCLADGEYSYVAGSTGGQFAALATVIGPTTAASYTALARVADYFVPNVTRRLGGADGWTTPIIVQSVNASRLTLSWYRFADGSLAATQQATMAPGGALRIDPRDVPGLSDGAQYAVVIDGNGGRLVAIVVQLNSLGGDGAAIYEGSAR